MLVNELTEKKLYKEIEELVSALGLTTVEVQEARIGSGASMQIYLKKRDGEITTEDLEAAYNIIYPRYQVLLKDRDLTLEITSPGMQRSFKDIYEFTIFKGKNVRVYSTKYSSYIVGTIKETTKASVILASYLIEDKKESGEELTLDFTDIAKAKLEYRWEGGNA